MAQARFPLLGSTTQATQGNSDAGTGKQCNREAPHTGKGGKLRFSRVSLFRKKPYDRPLGSDILDRRLPSDRQTSSLPARLVDSASNLLTSSASYLFESFFKRRQIRWISNGSQCAVERVSPDVRQANELKTLSENERHSTVVSSQQPSEQRVGDEDAEFLEVEDFLKRQLLSRDDVKRLTKVLQTRAQEDSLMHPKLEANKLQNAIVRASEESNPAQLAQAYMGRRMTGQWESTPIRLYEAVKTSSREIFDYGAKEGSSLEVSRRREAPKLSAQLLKKRFILDDDDVVLTMPVRRVRQKMTVTSNSSPYIRQVTAAAGRPQTYSLELKKPSDKTEKSLELLEGSLTVKGKSVEEPTNVLSPIGDVDVPESSNVRDMAPDVDKDSSALLISNELVESSRKEPEPITTCAPSTPEKTVTEPISEVPTAVTRGFHINAFFEDSSSDDEAILPAKASPLTEAHASGRSVFNQESLHEPATSSPSVHKDLQEENKQSVAVTLDNSIHFSDSNSVLAVKQASGGTMPFNIKSDSLPLAPLAAQSSCESALIDSTVEKQVFSFSSSKMPPLNSDVLLWPGKIAEAIGMPVSSTKTPLNLPSASFSSSPFPAPTFFSFGTALEAGSPFSKAETATALVTTSVPSESTLGKDPTKKEAVKRKVEATQIPGTDDLSFSSAAPQTVLRAENVMPNIGIHAGASKISATAEQSAVSVSSTTLFPATPASIPAVNQAGMSGTPPIISAAVSDNPVETGALRHSPMLESPNAENKQSDMDTMATDPMTEELDSSVGVLAASAPLFGSASNVVSTSTGDTATFGSRPSPSPFSFPIQSSTPAVSQPPFSSQSSGAAGQLFSFGLSRQSTVASPFSAATQSAFLFGSSSAAPSTSSIFPATSSAPLTFPATSSAPSPFLFGAQTSSSSTTSSSMFDGQMTQSAGGFTGGTTQDNTSNFSFQGPPTTPSPPAFQFGAANTGTSSSSAPLFGGQTFGFVAQPPSNALANPFAQSGGSHTAPFQFGSSTITASQPAASNFSFGGQPASSPFSFTFGAQTTPSPTGQPFGAQTTPPTGQPFGFSGQPAVPAPSPFNLQGSGQVPSGGASGMEFTGGFSLGAAGGEKSGRKFIKAKRIGGAKRGK